MCPVCSIGVVVGLGLSRWLKVDDSISGLWIGALILAISIWTFNWFLRKKEKKPIILLAIILIIYWLLTFVPLYAINVINNQCGTVFGINRLVFGSILGIIFSSISISIDLQIRKRNNGKGLFPYQKVIIPLAVLIILSLILHITC
jgi:hypothetical protein